MSIWSSIDPDGPDLLALDGGSEEANYRAEGAADVHIDVATTSAHDHIRIALWRDRSGTGSVDVEALLSLAAAALLRDRLAKALDRAHG